MYNSIEVCLLINKCICCFCLFVCLCDGGSCLRIACSTTLNNNKKEDEKKTTEKKLKIYKIWKCLFNANAHHIVCDKCEFGTFVTSLCFFLSLSSFFCATRLFFYYLLLISTCTPKIHKTKLIIQRNSEQITLFSSLRFLLRIYFKC